MRRLAVIPKDGEMTIQYFEDTDALYLVSKDTEVQESRDLDENTASPVRGER
jgi:hypothetical protein